MTKKRLAELLVRPNNSNKYDFGHVIVIGGSQGMTGAPLLAARAALRIGAGLVTVAMPKAAWSEAYDVPQELLSLKLGAKPTTEIAGYISDRKVNVAVVGPGLTSLPPDELRELISRLAIPTIIDAAAVLAFRDHVKVLKQVAVSKEITITPHAGEYAKLVGDMNSSIEDLQRHAHNLAQELGITIVFKGHPTMIFHPDGQTKVNSTGGPGLATAGTGDVLAGLIAGLTSQGLTTIQASEWGVYIHGLAGDIASKKLTSPAVTASDVINSIPDALKELGVK